MSKWDPVRFLNTVGCFGAIPKSGAAIFNTVTIKDNWNRPVLLFKNEWNVNQLLEDHPSLKLSAIAPITIGSSSVS
jgi:peptide chain release factor 3